MSKLYGTQKHSSGRPAKAARDAKSVSFAVGDLETDPFKEGRLEINPFCAGFFDGKTKETWWGEDCAKKFVDRLKKFDGVCFFHNGGNFDFHFLLEFLPVNECEFLCMGKRIVRIKLPWGAELRDSFAIIPKKLAAFAKDEVDYTKFEKDVREKHRVEILKYLRSDLENLYNMVQGYIKRFPLKVTLASSVYEMMKKEYDYNPGRSGESYDGKFRPFFYGGRVELWKQGEVKGKFHIVDINSAYPYAMTFQHWFGFAGEAVSDIPRKKMEQCLYVVECKAQGCFPFREKDGRINFPTKEGRFWVTGWELKAAQDLRLVKDLKVLVCYVPKEVKDIKTFSETLYGKKLAAKKAGDTEEEFFNKIAVNCGYGKLAFNPMRFSEVKVTTIYDKPDYLGENGKVISEAKAEKQGQNLWENCWDDKDRGLSFWKRKSYKEGIDKFVNVATAASITGFVRSMLLRAKQKAGGAVYCDTDSLILENIKHINFGEQLGQWKLELTCDSSIKKGQRAAITEKPGLWIGGKKLYCAFGITPDGKWKWKDASKGVKFSPDRIKSIAMGKTETKIFLAPTYSLFSKPKFVTREIKMKPISGNSAEKQQKQDNG
jgi:hypothetical protein